MGQVPFVLRICNRTAKLKTLGLGLISAMMAVLCWTGCAGTKITPLLPANPLNLRGVVRAGQLPLSGSVLSLYATGQSGDGSASTSLLSQTFKSAIDGTFTISGRYTCPFATSEVYLVAIGGAQSASGPANPSSSLMATLGPCGSLGSVDFATVNEVSTVGSIWPLAPYATSSTRIGSAAADAQLLDSAAEIAGKLVGVAKGTSPGPGLAAGEVAPTDKLYALANILAACAQSSGGSAGDGSPCGGLFSVAASPGAQPPSDTISAMIAIAQHPTRNVAEIYSLSPANGVFATSLSLPADWALPILTVPTAPTFFPSTGSLESGQSVSIAEDSAGATVYYTMDGSEPSATSPQYSGPIALTTSATIHAVAIKNSVKSSVVSQIFRVILPISVALSPLDVALSSAQSQMFTAAVSNASNPAVTWSLYPALGSISANGLYTAPAEISAPETVAVTATSVADQTKKATANVTLTGASGASLQPGPMLVPQGFMPSVKSYGAVGDGVTDDTAAIQAALADGRSDASVDYYGRPKALYFPPGTYLVQQTIQWVGCCLTLQGAGSSASIIRLAPKSAGFGDPSNPKPLILTPLGNQSFRQNIWDLGLSIGPNNPGATGLNYVSNNSGSVHNVLILSEDGKGHSGIDLTRQYAGPLLVRNTEIRGFDVGVDLLNAEYGSTFEAITLKSQHVAGIRNVNQPISIRGLASTNTVPALTNSGGSVVLLDAKLVGGDASNPAVRTNSSMYLRDVVSSGYGSTLSSTSGTSPAVIRGSINEYLVGAPQTLTGKATSRSLMLPVQETPSYVSSTLIDWAVFTPKWYGDTSGLQTALNSGKHTVYFPFAAYFSYDEAQVTIPDTVDRLVGFSSVINGSTAGANGGSIRLVVTSNSTTPLIIEEFGYGLKIDHRGSRPIVIKDAFVSYKSSPGAGDLFLEDVELGPLVMQPGQHVWARQFNNEASGTKISNPGGSLWVLGLKTEQAGTVINTTSGGMSEVLGALIYPSTAVPATDAAFRSTDSQVSYIYTEHVYCPSCGYATQVQETRSGVTKSISSSPSAAYQMPLFIGFR